MFAFIHEFYSELNNMASDPFYMGCLLFGLVHTLLFCLVMIPILKYEKKKKREERAKEKILQKREFERISKETAII